MAKNRKVNVEGIEILVSTEKEDEFISLTDIARYRDADRSDYILQNWMRNRSTIEFIGLWEVLITPILIPSNSMELKIYQVRTALL